VQDKIRWCYASDNCASHGFHILAGDVRKMLDQKRQQRGCRYDFTTAFDQTATAMDALLNNGAPIFVATDDREVFDFLRGKFQNHPNLFFAPVHEGGWNFQLSMRQRILSATTSTHVSMGNRETDPLDFLRDLCMLAECDVLHFTTESSIKHSFQGIRGKPFTEIISNSDYEPESIASMTARGRKEWDALLKNTYICALNPHVIIKHSWLDWTNMTSLEQVMNNIEDRHLQECHQFLFQHIQTVHNQELSGIAFYTWVKSHHYFRQVLQEYDECRKQVASKKDAPRFMKALLWGPLANYSTRLGLPMFVTVGDTIMAVDVRCLTSAHLPLHSVTAGTPEFHSLLDDMRRIKLTRSPNVCTWDDWATSYSHNLNTDSFARWHAHVSDPPGALPHE